MMKKGLITTQFVLALIHTLCASEGSPEERTSRSWTAMQILPNEICSMPFGNFRINIHEHTSNQKASPNRKRYFYTPIVLLAHKSAISIFNDVTNQAEFQFRVELWNDKVENDVAKYLSKILGEPVKTHQVQVIPFEKVILTSKDALISFSLSATWSLFKLQKSLSFTVTCFEQKDCDTLASNMRTSPRQFQTMQIHFSLLSQSSENKEIEIIVAGQMVARLLRQFKTAKEIFVTEKDESRLLTEIATTSAEDKFELNAVISSESLAYIYKIIKSLLIVPSDEVMTARHQNDPIWASVFWHNENYRPGKISQILNFIYEKQSREIQKKLADAFTSSNNADKIDLEEISQLFRWMETKFNVKNFDPTNSKDFLKNLYGESINHVEWDGEKFIPKPLVVSKVNLVLLRELYERNYPSQQKEHRSVNVRYSVAALSTPINLAQNSDVTAGTAESESLRSIVTSLAKEMKDMKIAVDKLNESFKASSETKASTAVAESTNKLTETPLMATEIAVPKPPINEVQPVQHTDVTTVSTGKTESVKNADANAIKETKSPVVGPKETALVIEKPTTKDENKPNVLQVDKEISPEKKLFKLINATSPNLKEVEDLINGGVDINCRDEQQMTPLLRLMKISNIKEKLEENIQLLIRLGSDVKTVDNNGWTAIHYLCSQYQKDNLVDITRLLIESGVDAIAKTNNGETALHTACRFYQNKNLIEFIRYLIQNGGDVKAKTNYGLTALHAVCQVYHKENLIDIIRLLVENSVDVKAKTTDGRTALHYACEHQKENLIEIVRVLIQSGIDVKEKTNYGATALNTVCKFYQKENLLEIIRLLIQNGVNVSAKDKDVYNALHLVCELYKNDNLIEIIKLLIQSGIDVKDKTNRGENALHIVSRSYQKENLIEIVRLLLQSGIDVKEKEIFGHNALHFLGSTYKNVNLIEIIRLYIQNGADAKEKNRDGYSILHYVCQFYNNENLIEVIRFLTIENGVDPKEKTKYGMNALHTVCRSYAGDNLIEVIRFLIQNGVDVKEKTENASTALHLLWEIAFKLKNLTDIIRLLIKHGADVNAKDIGGWTPLDHASKFYYKENKNEILELLGGWQSV